jgi:hypothetical protein
VSATVFKYADGEAINMPRKRIPGAAAARAARYRKRKRQVTLPPEVTGLVSTSTDATTSDDDDRVRPGPSQQSQEIPAGENTQEVLCPELEVSASLLEDDPNRDMDMSAGDNALQDAPDEPPEEPFDDPDTNAQEEGPLPPEEPIEDKVRDFLFSLR